MSRACSTRAAPGFTVYEPKAMDNVRRTYPDLAYADSLEAVTGVEIVALLTEDIFKLADPIALG